jgi:hypothetical protein
MKLKIVKTKSSCPNEWYEELTPTRFIAKLSLAGVRTQTEATRTSYELLYLLSEIISRKAKFIYPVLFEGQMLVERVVPKIGGKVNLCLWDHPLLPRPDEMAINAMVELLTEGIAEINANAQSRQVLLDELALYEDIGGPEETADHSELWKMAVKSHRVGPTYIG